MTGAGSWTASTARLMGSLRRPAARRSVVTVFPIGTETCDTSYFCNNQTCGCSPGSTPLRTTTLRACQACPTNYACPDGVTRTLCTTSSDGTNTYQDQTGQSSCKVCPAKAVMQTDQLTGLVSCKCSAGRYLDTSINSCEACPINSFCINQVKTPCSTGQYQPNIQQGQCIPCPTGPVFTTAAAYAVCNCPNGFFKMASSTNWTCVECPGGYDCSSGALVPCSSLTYRPDGSSTLSCSRCPTITLASLSPLGGVIGTIVTTIVQLVPTDDRKSCVCSNGYYNIGSTCAGCPPGSRCTGGVRVECPPNRYSGAMADSCLPCATGLVAPANSSSCRCPDTQYQGQNGACIACPYGSECNGITMTPCPDGTVRGPTQIKCAPCPPPSTADPLRTSCLCPSGSFNNGTACITCTSPFVINSAATGCVCPSGTYLNNKVCTACPLGSACVNGVATPCPMSMYQDGSTPGACQRCPASSATTYLGAKSLVECMCAQGMYMDRSKATPICTRCNIGSFCPGDTTQGMYPCDKGQYQPLVGQTACQRCPEFSTTQSGGSTDFNSCICDDGLYMTSKSCNSCPVGNYCEANKAIPCDPRSIAPTGGALSCTQCLLENQVADDARVNCVCVSGYIIQSDGSCALAPPIDTNAVTSTAMSSAPLESSSMEPATEIPPPSTIVADAATTGDAIPTAPIPSGGVAATVTTVTAAVPVSDTGSAPASTSVVAPAGVTTAITTAPVARATASTVTTVRKVTTTTVAVARSVSTSIPPVAAGTSTATTVRAVAVTTASNVVSRATASATTTGGAVAPVKTTATTTATITTTTIPKPTAVTSATTSVGNFGPVTATARASSTVAAAAASTTKADAKPTSTSPTEDKKSPSIVPAATSTPSNAKASSLTPSRSPSSSATSSATGGGGGGAGIGADPVGADPNSGGNGGGASGSA
eukprot:Opistho-2@32662